MFFACLFVSFSGKKPAAPKAERGSSITQMQRHTQRRKEDSSTNAKEEEKTLPPESTTSLNKGRGAQFSLAGAVSLSPLQCSTSFLGCCFPTSFFWVVLLFSSLVLGCVAFSLPLGVALLPSSSFYVCVRRKLTLQMYFKRRGGGEAPPPQRRRVGGSTTLNKLGERGEKERG